VDDRELDLQDRYLRFAAPDPVLDRSRARKLTTPLGSAELTMAASADKVAANDILASPEPVWSLSAVAPIPGRPLLAQVQDLLPPSGRGPLPGGGEPLPDEPPRDPSKVRFGGGSLDGIMSVRGGRSDGNESLAAASASA
jgi:hypothetical protein